MTILAYQGTFGSYSYQACQELFPDSEYKGCDTFDQAMKIVLQERADIAVIPVDNSSAGRVMEVYNYLPQSGLSIVGEYFMPIHHCLLMPTKIVRGLPPENLTPSELIEWKEREPSVLELDKAMKKVTRVYSHPQGLAQCQRFLRTHLAGAEQREAWDTAGAARDLNRDINSTDAAIASKDAIRYNMTVIRENIEDDPDNTTRFLLLARNKLDEAQIEECEKNGEDIITTLMFQTPNIAGSLVTALEVFRKHNINLTKLETYMMGEKHSQPHFYVDVMFNPNTDFGKEVLQDLFEVTIEYKHLGTYVASKMR